MLSFPVPKSLLSLLPAGRAVDQVVVAHDRILAAVHARTATARVRCAGVPRAAFTAIMFAASATFPGRAVSVNSISRCAAPECPRRVFAERLPAVASPRVRRKVRFAEAQRRIALSADGEAGACLAAWLAMPVSGDTLLRLIRAAPLPAAPTSRVIGIDDWSWRRGQRYGTIIVDLECNRPIDLLPNRHAERIAAWLKVHPGVEVVARNRAGAYAHGVRTGVRRHVKLTVRWICGLPGQRSRAGDTTCVDDQAGRPGTRYRQITRMRAPGSEPSRPPARGIIRTLPTAKMPDVRVNAMNALNY